jgi:hypothetical protein
MDKQIISDHEQAESNQSEQDRWMSISELLVLDDGVHDGRRHQ